MSPKSEVAIGARHGGTEQSRAHNGQGTSTDPFIVEFKRDDPENPMNWSASRKWFIAFIVTSSVFAVTFASSAYSDSSDEIIKDFNISTEVFSVGISLFILGFAVGPAVWAPLSELYGRKIFWIISHIGMVAFIGGTAGSRNITTLLVLRFVSGTFGGSPLVNAGGAIADIFPPVERGLAMIVYSFAPLLGPLVGPIISGFVSENVGWRWVQGMCCIFVGVIGVIGTIFVPETYGPVLLLRKAKRLTKSTGKVHLSILERDQGKKNPSEVFQRALIRPWVLLIHEPIVTVASIYIALGYGTTYMFMGAMPIVYNEDRGWSEGIGGLAFLGLAIGEILGLVYAGYDYHRRYMKLYNTGKATPESRLPTAIVGSIALPIGIFGFAWTNYPSIHWSASIILSAPFGFGCILMSLSITNYLVDSYTIYAATALAALAIVRSAGGAVFPLFTNQMYHNLGIHWASCVPGFLTVACIPFPIVMYRYGELLRMKCKYTFEAAELMRRMQKQQGFGQVESGERVDEEGSA